ncbi:gamma-glutamylcyclotransferase [Rossellomorea aquimaris]|uniref:gamma-glutamylcyclotransferase n=1 Tax=Rossellomorea aquimaris TaxID=189382 RepID=UPI001CD59F1F|nr:gamma-glutamylcyclotransferase family protein [Rossellomorea aquimaris]MCA1053959.1 gamma-glutamylcyclotransferase [Rossellomorea aquimaris]
MNVFVYGTLRRHESNHYLLEGAELLHEQAWVKGELFDTGAGYPALKEGDGFVYGEIYKINDGILHKLDDIEDFIEGREDNLYHRQIQRVETDQGQTEAYVYFGLVNKMFKTVIHSGDWKVHQFIETKPERILYFAYGSCMDDARFKLAKVDHHFKKCLGAGFLKGYTMKYLFKVEDGGRGDIIEDGGSMEGVVYDVPQEAVEYLFKREGVVPGWYRAAFIDVVIKGKRYNDVLTFIVKTKFHEVLPPDHYAREILRGSMPHVSREYHDKLQKQLLDLGMTEDQVKGLMDDPIIQ